MPRALALDTDMGSDADDALCLALALAAPELELVAVTCVGNEAMLRARIARKLLELAGAEHVPVYAGCRVPLLGGDGYNWFGHEGLGILEPGIEPPIERAHAVDALLELSHRAPRPRGLRRRSAHEPGARARQGPRLRRADRPAHGDGRAPAPGRVPRPRVPVRRRLQPVLGPARVAARARARASRPGSSPPTSPCRPGCAPATSRRWQVGLAVPRSARARRPPLDARAAPPPRPHAGRRLRQRGVPARPARARLRLRRVVLRLRDARDRGLRSRTACSARSSAPSRARPRSRCAARPRSTPTRIRAHFMERV